MLYFSEYSSAIRKPKKKKKCVIQHNVGYNKASFCLHMTNIMYSDCKCKNILARATWSNTFWMRMYFVASWLAWLNHSWQANVPITCCHMIVQLCISNGVKCMDAIQHWSRATKKKKKNLRETPCCPSEEASVTFASPSHRLDCKFSFGGISVYAYNKYRI